ncbi:MAG: S8 family serine peptidase [Candidatus Sumerlaeota bacterium]|nr:S8 family serine peptidase [Candidatus Sumerlaeota bacterium]
MNTLVDPSFHSDAALARLRDRLVRGIFAGPNAAAICAESAGGDATSEAFRASLEKQVYESLERVLARWKRGEIQTPECLAEAGRHCDETQWPLVFVAAADDRLTAVREELGGLGYRLSGDSDAFEEFGLVAAHAPPLMDLIEPMAAVADVRAIYDAGREVSLPPMPPLGISAELAEAMPAIDPNGARQRIGLGRCGQGIRVCVLDTGVDEKHPDLQDAIEATADFTGEGGPADPMGHGTHVAGIIAGRGRASGGAFTGVAPAARILSGRILGASGSGSLETLMWGLRWALYQKADIVNLSLGYQAANTDGASLESRACDTLVKRGIVVVVSAGNKGPGAGTIGIPADSREAITVGAMSRQGGVCDFSSCGPTASPDLTGDKPSIVAPGEMIISCRSADSSSDLWPPIPGHESYAAASGTSMAAPMVSGVIAVFLGESHAAGNRLTPSEVKRLLLAACSPVPGCNAAAQGKGAVNLSRLMEDCHGRAGTPRASTAPDATPGIGKDEKEIMDDQVLSVETLAKYLKLKPVTVYKLLRQGKAPGFKVGGAWRFRKSTIDDWIARNEQLSLSEPARPEPESEPQPGKPNPAKERFAVECGVCGLRLASPPRNHCEEADCGIGICDKCWNVSKRHFCRAHRSQSAKTSPKPAAAGQTGHGLILSGNCPVCGRPLDDASRLCEASGCENRICALCRNGGDPYPEPRRRCPDHQDANLAQPVGAGKVIPQGGEFTCGYCGRDIYAHEIGGNCEECESPICNTCREGLTTGLPEHRCRSHARAATKPAALPSRDAILISALAQLAAAESAFLERVRAQFAETKELYHPVTGEPAAFTKAWKLTGETSSDTQLMKVFKKHPRLLKGLSSVPGNRELAYSIAPNKSTADIAQGALVVLVRFLSRAVRDLLGADEELLSKLFDVKNGGAGQSGAESLTSRHPWSMTELSNLLAAEAAEARRKKRFEVLALFSPDGWDDEAIAMICAAGNGKSGSRFASPNLSVILLGPNVPDCRFNPSVARAALVAPLFSPELPSERLAQCANAVDSQLVGAKYVTLDSLMSILPFPKGLIRAAMESLTKKNKEYTLEIIKDIGLTLRKRSEA